MKSNPGRQANAASHRVIEWHNAPIDYEQAAALCHELKVPLPMAALLLGRGINSAKSAKDYFGATLADLPSPFLMQGMNRAVELIITARQQGSPVLIYGDYDVDGTTASAVLLLFLRQLGIKEVTAVQPQRLEDGYGLHPEVVRRAAPGFVACNPLLITVDCGISCAPEVRTLKEEGWQVVITDHHRPPDTLPQADALLNPLLPDCSFPDKNLAGVGVAFYLAMGVRNRLKELGDPTANAINLKEFLDLVAIGTVADMVSLTGVNRIMVKAGLEVLGSSRRLGLIELLNVSGIRGPVTTEGIAFRLAPRLNAAGRLGRAQRALELLISNEKPDAQWLAGELNNENNHRKELVESIVQQASQQAAEAVSAGKLGLVLSGAGWHPGVIGIVAARIAEQFHRPTVLLSVENGKARGSARTTADLDIHQILNETRELFTEFGGHKGAAGMGMASEHIAKLEKHFSARVAELLSEEMLRPRLLIDWQEQQHDTIFSPAFLSLYQGMAPFGCGNPEPVFMATGTMKEARVVGGKHLKFAMHFPANHHLGGIAFGMSDFLASAMKPGQLNTAFRLRLNNFNQKTQWQMEAVDFSSPTV